MPASRRLASWTRPRSSSPTVPIYFARIPSFATVATALATWPPGLRISSSNGNFARVGGKVRNQDECIGRVQSDTRQIEFVGSLDEVEKRARSGVGIFQCIDDFRDMVLAGNVVELYAHEILLELLGEIARLFGKFEIIPLAIRDEKRRSLRMDMVNGRRIIAGPLKRAERRPRCRPRSSTPRRESRRTGISYFFR